MTTVALKCRCGSVQGTASNVSAPANKRIICCCDDCQAFATYLQQQADTLDRFGGTDLITMNQAQIAISQGQDKLRCMRLRRKGLLRWYTECCNTPVALTLNARMPFASVVHNFIDAPDRDSTLGPVMAWVQIQHAIGTPDYPTHSAKFPLGITLRTIGRMAIWKLQGLNKPSPFFTTDGQPIAKPTVIAD